MPSGSGKTNIAVALIAPNDATRQAMAKAISATCARIVREFAEYPHPGALSKLLDSGCAVVIADLDADVEQGLEIVELVSRRAGATVIGCSSRNEADIVIRAMRAGAREFLVAPFAGNIVVEALERAAARLESAAPERSLGRLIVFQGSKGGTGVTTLACNFAVALTREGAGRVALVDMHPQLGEIALSLGLTPQFTIADALGNTLRLDADFLSSLLVRHESGLMVLASSDSYGVNRSIERGADKLLRIAREEFAYVVVDAGPCCASIPEALFDSADIVYLVTEVNLPALRNARRLISWFSERERGGNLEVVLNRYNSHTVEIDEQSAIKALTRCVDWRIPNDYNAVRGAQNLGVPLVNQQTALSKVIGQMAQAASGRPAQAGENKNLAFAGEKWKFWTSSSTRPLSTAHS
ncbi:MAG TPA: AAA family ATPase [Bryobacteraceae bacterium]|nr:AAA family ATPase [Bryobacteraceae bacterium]